VSINAGTATGSTVANRLMASGANTAQYEIYSDSGRTTIWGDLTGGTILSTNVTTDSSGNASATIPMYGRLAAQTQGNSGTYSSGNLTVTATSKPGGSGCTSGSGTSVASTFIAQVILTASCTITPTGVNFGSLSSLATTQNTSSSISVTCTSGAAYTIAMDAGTSTGNTISARKMALGGVGAGVVSYQLYRDSGPANVWGDGTTGVV
jgi:spore coat protein U-like protein